MTTTTLITISPEELESIINRAISPYAESLRTLEIKAGTRKYAYTVAEVAQLISYHPKTVLIFIREGRQDRKGRIIRLKAKVITHGDYRIKPTDLEAFIDSF